MRDGAADPGSRIDLLPAFAGGRTLRWRAPEGAFGPAAARGALASLPTEERVWHRLAAVAVDYAAYGSLRHAMPALGVQESAFLDTLEERTFRYFWDLADPELQCAAILDERTDGQADRLGLLDEGRRGHEAASRRHPHAPVIVQSPAPGDAAPCPQDRLQPLPTGRCGARCRSASEQRAARRRMAYLLISFVAPAMGVFPYLLLIGWPTRFSETLFWSLLIVGNVGVATMLALMAYSVAFIGALTPDRVIKYRLVRFLLRRQRIAAGQREYLHRHHRIG